MRTLIFIVVTLHLVIGKPNPAEELQYKYGDIIAFSKTGYSHYAIYVDQNRFPEQKVGQNLFHFTGPILQKGLSGCVFGKIKANDKHKLDNYLDNIKDFKNTVHEAAITERIKEKYESCKKKVENWKPRSNNCEHLATYIRYGVKVSLQCGKFAAKLMKNPDIPEELLNQIKADLEKTQGDVCEEFCKTTVIDGISKERGPNHKIKVIRHMR